MLSLVIAWEKIKTLWNFSVFLVQNFFLIFVLTSASKNKKIATLIFFIDAYIFSDRCFKNHKFFIFPLLLVVFWILNKKSGRITCEIFWYLFGFRMSTEEMVKRRYRFWTTDEIYNTCLWHRLVPFGTQFMIILFLQKKLNKILGAIDTANAQKISYPTKESYETEN
jgi:hypothetical protein